MMAKKKKNSYDFTILYIASALHIQYYRYGFLNIVGNQKLLYYLTIL